MDTYRNCARTAHPARRFALTASLVVGVATSRWLFRDWGATKGECETVLPGDELVPDPAVTVTRAVTIRASADEVWRWLVQIGQDRGGMYSYDWLENLVGLRIHSTESIRPGWQHLEVGDDIRLVRAGWLGLDAGYVLKVAAIDRGRALVLHDDAFHSIWSFHIHPVGTHRCRLISRSRAPKVTSPLAVFGELIDPITFVMTRGMLLGIKRRAEGREPIGIGLRAKEIDHARDPVVR
jgi:hypothetical protein